MVQSPSWEANWFAASQEIPRISRNPKVHYRTQSVRHLSLSWASPIQSIYPHPGDPSTHLRLGLLSGIFPSGFSNQRPIHPPLSSPIRVTYPVHLILLDFIIRTILGEEYKSFNSFPPFPRYLPPSSKYSPQHHVLKHPRLRFFTQCQRPSFTTVQNNRKNYSSIYLGSLNFWIASWKSKDSAPNDSKYFLTSVCF